MGVAPWRRLRARSDGTVTRPVAHRPAPAAGCRLLLARRAPAGGVLAHQVVPGARRAHLDLVAEHRLGPAAERLELGRGARAAPARWELGPEDEGDRDEPPVVTDGADLLGGPAHVAGRPEQLGVGVAHVGPQDLAPLDLPDHGVADDPVLHLGRDVRAHRTGFRPRLRGDGHGAPGYPPRPETGTSIGGKSGTPAMSAPALPWSRGLDRNARIAISKRYTHPSCWTWPSSASSKNTTSTATRYAANCGSTWAFSPTSPSAPSTPP